MAEPHFDAARGGWSVPSIGNRHGAITISGGSLAATLPSERDLGDAIIPIAWLDGMFVDVGVAVTVQFDGPVCGAAAGLWLRVRDGSAFTAMVWDTGEISIATRYDDGFGSVLATYGTKGREAARAARLSVILRDYALVVACDGRPLGSLSVAPRYAGAVHLRAQVGRDQARVVFSDPIARLA